MLVVEVWCGGRGGAVEEVGGAVGVPAGGFTPTVANLYNKSIKLCYPPLNVMLQNLKGFVVIYHFRMKKMGKKLDF